MSDGDSGGTTGAAMRSPVAADGRPGTVPAGGAAGDNGGTVVGSAGFGGMRTADGAGGTSDALPSCLRDAPGVGCRGGDAGNGGFIGEYCRWPLSDSGGSHDALGVCAQAGPTASCAGVTGSVVCGCDGTFYNPNVRPTRTARRQPTICRAARRGSLTVPAVRRTASASHNSVSRAGDRPKRCRQTGRLTADWGTSVVSRCRCRAASLTATASARGYRNSPIAPCRPALASVPAPGATLHPSASPTRSERPRPPPTAPAFNRRPSPTGEC